MHAWNTKLVFGETRFSNFYIFASAFLYNEKQYVPDLTNKNPPICGSVLASNGIFWLLYLVH